jgi:hypothetical protein
MVATVMNDLDAVEPHCDECGILSENAPEWCGECGNCGKHCANEENCADVRCIFCDSILTFIEDNDVWVDGTDGDACWENEPDSHVPDWKATRVA